MSYRLLALPLLSIPFIALPSFADSNTDLETMVVTATRTPTSIHKIGSSITVISADDIDRRQFQTLADALQDVPGMHIVQTGVKGSQTSVFMRGTKSEHTMVLIDGIEMNDPSSPTASFDFANFLLEDIESIEIVRGSQSVLYGSDAIGGVIHIRTRTGKGKTKIRGKVEAGMNSTHHETISLSGENGDISYAVSMGLLKTDGESITPEKYSTAGGVSDDDGYDNKVFSTKLRWQASSNFAADFSARYIKTQSDIDGFLAEDIDRTNDSEQLFIGANFIGFFFDEQWQSTFSIARTDIERKNKDGRRDVTETLEDTKFEGIKNKFSLQNDLLFFDNQIITVGLEYEDEKVNADGFTSFGDSGFGHFIITQNTHSDRQTKSAYIQDQISFNDKISTVLGVRYDAPNDFGSEISYRATTSYQITDASRVYGSYSTGFRAPSIYELYGHQPNNYGAYTGNPNLKPETSQGWEVGVEKSLWQNKINAKLTYYKSNIEDLMTIKYSGGNSTTINIDEVDIHGVESSLNILASPYLDIGINYTYTSIEDKDNIDTELVRRPKHKANLNLDIHPTDKMTITTSILYTGSRSDVAAFGNTVKVGGYSIINVATNYQVTPQTRVFARIDNLGNKIYEPALNFQALGLTGYLGIELVNY